jgi:outer membrane protein assembly factor BamB
VVGELVVTQGATGIVHCLDARTGNVIWSHNAHAEQGADDLTWGKSGSPLVVDDMVVISVGASADAKKQESYDSSLVAYDLATGDIRWAAGSRTTSYASPVLATFAGTEQIVQINENYVTAHRAADGEVLWEHAWPGSSSGDASCSQPVPLDGDRLFLSRNYGGGASLVTVSQDEAGNWQATPLWQPPVKRVMKTKFSNVLIRDGYVYGLDGIVLQCIELETGKSQWKKRRSPAFGHGQVMLVGDHLLVLSEIGELALVACTPDEYRELAAIQVLDEGDVTWNNPALSAPYLLVRNGREAACYRLSLSAVPGR